MGEALHILLHAFEDTLVLVPFLLATYLLMELLEGMAGEKAARAVQKAGRAGPLIGGLLGVVPQCGFSAAAATLWSGRVVTVGTLVAVFLSTSDELLPVFLAEGAPAGLLVRVLAAKALVAVAVGTALDAVLRRMRRAGDGRLHVHELCEREHCGCDHGHGHGRGSVWLGAVRSTLVHAAQVALFIFLVTFVLDGTVHLVGEDALAAFVAGNPVFSVFASALVGLIPNCAASVVVAELYLDGTLGAAALMAGSLVSAGVGLLVLLRTNVRVGQSLAVVAFLYVVGVAVGLAMLALGLGF